MHHRTTAILAWVALLTAGSAHAQIRAALVTGGLSQPVAIAQDPSNPSVQLIAQQAGRIRVLVNGALQPTDFLDLTGVVTPGGGERGLLGVAFAPDFAASGRVFVSFTDTAGNSVVSRFVRASTSPLTADSSTRFDLTWPGGGSWIEQPFSNHNGGNIAFGPDGYLYLGLGDGGSSNDPDHRAQDPATLLGKMLRLDVSVADNDPEGYDIPGDNPFVGTGALGEIWSLGLRNPWRFSFDDPGRGGTGALVIADVGQNAWEEIDYEPAGAGGRNYGWRNFEGTQPNVESLPLFSTPTSPTFEYSHSEGRSITGGFVYRGTALGAAYTGRYFFGDFVRGRVWSLGLSINGGGEAVPADLVEHTAELGAAAESPSSFGVDGAGEILVLTYGTGEIYRLVAATGAGGPPVGCTPPDPFLAMGGGTCANGDWLPPGYPAPGSTPPPDPATPPSGGGCATPDPFTTLGGGICHEGNWLPPGYPIPPGSTPAPDPTTPPPPPSGGCTTPDPFEVLGGGTCLNGDWLPPGYPAPPTTPPPGGGDPPPSGCVTPDPFVVLGGGTCVDGNWLPPGYPSASGSQARSAIWASNTKRGPAAEPRSS